jgi:ABC-type Fe3+/spermidine/putrescine transport system ATPase subunit
MVFQHYALFPHMTVFANVAYGLRVRHVARDEVARRVEAALELVDLTRESARWPRQLSGGQQQRVALARVLVLEPEVLLLDEPFGALDAKLRRAMQVDLRKLIARVGITTVFVTHDQDEALTLSDRVAVMRDGRIEQVGAPLEIYDRPASPYVADFVGASNLFERVVTNGSVELYPGAVVPTEHTGAVTIVVRPEHLRVDAETTKAGWPGTVTFVKHTGAVAEVEAEVGEARPIRIVAVRDRARPLVAVGDRVRIWLAEPDACVVHAGRLPR